MYRKGIDVSAWQGDAIDWEAVKASGVEFVMLRAGTGRGSVDTAFRRNAAECNRLGIPIGVYWFSYALNPDMAAAEARTCLDTIRPYQIEFPVCYDLEYDTVWYAKSQGVKINKRLASEMVRAFCRVVKEAGYIPMNYGNGDFMRNYFDSTVPVEFPLWFAQWPKDPDFDNPPRETEIWQYSDSGSVPGIPGKVDMDVCYADYGMMKGDDEEMVKRYNTLAEIQADMPWAADTVRSLVDKGAIRGSGEKDAEGYPADMNLSEDMIRMMVVNDRAGVYAG